MQNEGSLRYGYCEALGVWLEDATCSEETCQYSGECELFGERET